MTNSSIIYSLLACIWQKKVVDIKLPVPITDAKTMHNFSSLHKLHHKKLQFINGLLFRDHILKFHDIFST